MQSSYTVREAAGLTKQSESTVRRLIDEGHLELQSTEGVRRVTQASLYAYLRDRVEELLTGINELAETRVSLEASDAAQSRIEELEGERTPPELPPSPASELRSPGRRPRRLHGSKAPKQLVRHFMPI